MDYPMVRERVKAGRLALHGWHCETETGEVHVFDAAQGGFVPAAQSSRAGAGPHLAYVEAPRPAAWLAGMTVRKLLQTLRGAFAFVLLATNTLFWCLLLFALALVKLALPFEPVRRHLDRALNAVATAWISLQHRLDAPDAADPLGRARRRRAQARWLVPGQQQPPELGRHLRAAAGAEPPHPAAQVLPQAGADLRAGDRAGLVGAGLPVHEAPRQGGAARQPRPAPAGHRNHPPRLREIRPHADQRHQLRRGHALHGRQAPRPGLALPPPAQAQGRRRWRLRWAHWARASTAWWTPPSSTRTARPRSGTSSAAGCRRSACASANWTFPRFSAAATTKATWRCAARSTSGWTSSGARRTGRSTEMLGEAAAGLALRDRAAHPRNALANASGPVGAMPSGCPLRAAGAGRRAVRLQPAGSCASCARTHGRLAEWRYLAPSASSDYGAAPGQRRWPWRC